MRYLRNCSPERRREIARMGGLAVHQKGTAHVLTPEEGQKGRMVHGSDHAYMVNLGRKGGLVTSADRAHMAELGRMGTGPHKKKDRKVSR